MHWQVTAGPPTWPFYQMFAVNRDKSFVLPEVGRWAGAMRPVSVLLASHITANAPVVSVMPSQQTLLQATLDLGCLVLLIRVRPG